MSLRLFLIGFLLLVMLSACGAWKPDKLEATTAEAIDSRLTEQMVLADFKAEFPDAVLVEGDEHTGVWFVSAQEVCFWCRTSDGFQRSMDVYARVVQFEGGRLARIEAAKAAQ